MIDDISCFSNVEVIGLARQVLFPAKAILIEAWIFGMRSSAFQPGWHARYALGFETNHRAMNILSLWDFQ